MRTAKLLLSVAGLLLVLTACSGEDAGGSTDQPTAGSTALPEGMVLVETEIGTVGRPEEWQPAPEESSVGQEASFTIEDGSGEVVGQMDVIVQSATPDAGADAIAATIQGTRMPSIPTLRHDRREFTEVPGAEDAFLTASHYTTADTGVPAKSIELVAVREDGRFLLVRISSTKQAYDAELFQSVLDTMRLRTTEPS